MAIDADEQRKRGQRLIIILVVVLALILGAVVWVRLSTNALNDEARSAKVELRSKWQSIDLVNLAKQYSSAGLNVEGKVALFPVTENARFFTARFSSADSVRAQYVVDAWTRQRCISMTARGATPNRVRFSESDGDC